jgi:hypothetical protein
MSVYAEKIGDLEEVGKPGAIYIDNGQLYVVDSAIVHIYSIKDFKHVKSFGKKGEGPREFKNQPLLTIYKDSILANSMGKVTYFTRDGEFKVTKKIPFNYNYFALPLVSLDDYYIGMLVKGRGSMKNQFFKERKAIMVFDQSFGEVKEIYKGIVQLPPPPIGAGRRQVKINVDAVNDCFDYQVYDNKLFIGDTVKGFYFTVFDHKGKHLYDIKKDEPEIEVTKPYQDGYMKRKMAAKSWEQEKKRFEFVFRKNYPAYFAFQINDGKIYVSTYKEKGGKFEVVVLDMKGKEIKRSFAHPVAPYNRISEIGHFKNEYAVYKDKLYYIVDNEDNEMWELHAEKI